MKDLMLRLVREEEGQDLIEYALLIVFVALLCVTLINGLLGGAVDAVFADIVARLTPA